MYDAVNWWKYVKSASGKNPTDIAKDTGIDRSTIVRWEKGSEPSPKFVRDFAIAYGKPVLEAFIAAGFLTKEEANISGPEIRAVTIEVTESSFKALMEAWEN